MKILDLFIGLIIGLATAFIGTYLFIELITKNDFAQGIRNMQAMGLMGKVITLGAILNIIAFFILLQLKKEMMARGVIVATFILALLTVII